MGEVLMGIERKVTVADAWPNDDGGVTLAQDGNLLPVSVEEAALFSVQVMNAALEAAQKADDRDAAKAIADLQQRLDEDASTLRGVM